MPPLTVSPILSLNDCSAFKHCTYPIWLKYEVFNDDGIQGNKYWKLYGLKSFLQSEGFSGICTFGGAHSNHLAAIASWREQTQIPVIGVVRGEMPSEESSTLVNARQKGVELKFVSRSDYRMYTHGLKKLPTDLCPEGYFILPEGGSTHLLFEGVSLFVEQVIAQFNKAGQQVPKDWFLPAGTGGSMAGLLFALNRQFKVHAINVLKNDGLQQQIIEFMRITKHLYQASPVFHHQYHMGGYAKYNQELIDFMQIFYDETSIYLDPVYTGKLLFAVSHWTKTTNQQPDNGLLIWHTGGLQGIEGFNKRWGSHLPDPTKPGINLSVDHLGILQ